MGLFDRLFGRRGRGSDAPLPTRDDTLSSTNMPPPGDPDQRDEDERDDQGAQADQGWVAPPDPDVKVDEPSAGDPGVTGGDTADTGGGDGGGDGGGGNGGGGGD
jgi:hypothetical protein